jgi:two-component system, OmpR family, sensor histidine kinase KdpD
VVVCLLAESLDFYPAASDAEITIIRANPRESLPQADLYIWDYTPGLERQVDFGVKGKPQQLLLCDPKHVDLLTPLQRQACILLKPVSMFTMRTFVELAKKNRELHRQADEADTLRSDRDALLQYVLEVNLKLQEYDQERSTLLARALHDFHSPLTALHGYCGLLSEGRLGEVSGTQRDLLMRMKHSTKRLARLAGGTLELLLEGRLERSPKLVEADLEEVVWGAVHEMYLFLQDKEIELDVRMQAPAGSLRFEPEKIEQVVVNLLENACKYTPRRGRIEIRGYSTLEIPETGTHNGAGPKPTAVSWYRVDISDSGPGVPDHLTEKVFEQYATYTGSSDRSGAGLGLAICRAILAAHSGMIWSKASCEGGRFSFALPLGFPRLGYDA